MYIDGVILAAGLSTRASAHKMMLMIGGKTILGRCIEALYDSCKSVIVVGGHKIESLLPICSRYSRVRLVYNKDFISGMFSSVKAGLRHVESDKFFLTPGDYPFIKKNTCAALANTEGDIVIPEYKGIRGHPVLMKSIHINQILQSSKYVSLRDFIEEGEITLVDTNDPGILIDIDTMSDYERALQFYNEV